MLFHLVLVIQSGLPYGHPPQPASPGGFSHGASPQQAHAVSHTVLGRIKTTIWYRVRET